MATPRRDEKKSRERQARAARAAAARRRRMVKTLTGFGVVIVVLGLIAASFQMFGSSSDTASSTSTTTSTTVVPTACPNADGSSPRTIDFKAPMAMCIDASKKYTATFDTTEGTVVVALDTTKTPNTVNNFVALSRYHYYDGSQIFRTDPSIDIIQGGGPHTQDNSDPGPGYNIKDEGTGFKYTEGDLVMARSQGADSASAQFFFATGPNVSQLDSQGTYVTFGHASSGVDVLKKIIGLHVATSDGLGGKPSHTVTINKITIAEA
jgi:cyclophilin family peptidyl-prolyl cis-trans isomerase